MKKTLLLILAILLLAILGALYFFGSDSSNPYNSTTWGKFSGSCPTEESPDSNFGADFAKCDYGVPSEEIPTFSEIAFPFTNEFNNKKTLPLMAMAMIDVDNDGVDEVFVGGGSNQKDALFKYVSNQFVEISNEVDLPSKPEGSKTLGAVSVDLDNNGFSDILLTGDFGLIWYKNDNGQFKEEIIDVTLTDKSIAATATVGDINNDGHLDIFLSAYIKLDKMEGQTIFKDFSYGASSILLQNNGDNSFSDVTEPMGLSYVHNTFQGIFVDLDNDGYLDLVVAHDTGEARTYRNLAGEHFQLISNPTTGKYAYPMGIALGDYNNDGFMDLFFSNTGSSVPEFLARGDLDKGDEFISKWILLRNNGDLSFTDVASETKVADFEFSWGAIFQDFNLDGRQDLVVAENYVDFPPHKLFKLPCRFFIQRADGTFSAVEEQAGVVNKNYAISPLTSDFNEDGYPDLIYSNLSGTVKAFINDGSGANYVGFRFAETHNNVGAMITIQLSDGTKLTDAYVIGEGLSSDQTSTLSFGLGANEKIVNAVVQYPGGSSVTITNPDINMVHKL